MAAAVDREAPDKRLHIGEEDRRKTAVGHDYLRMTVVVVDTAV